MAAGLPRPPPSASSLPVALPNARLLFVINLITVLTAILFAVGVVIVVFRRNYRRRVEEQKLAAMGTATARILHQIKNPLQTILLHADLLQDTRVAADDASRREICDAIVGEAQRLTAMLAELSVYASGARRALTLEPFPLHDLLMEMIRSESRRSALRVEVTRMDEAVVRADPYYLRQALENLISNARDAMEGQPDARLTVAVEREGEMAVVGVADTGPGITPERMSTIFEPFATGKTKGMGLGLAICKEIVEGHGGRIEVQSGSGVGTRFRVLLPVYEPKRIETRSGGGS